MLLLRKPTLFPARYAIAHPPFIVLHAMLARHVLRWVERSRQQALANRTNNAGWSERCSCHSRERLEHAYSSY